MKGPVAAGWHNRGSWPGLPGQAEWGQASFTFGLAARRNCRERWAAQLGGACRQWLGSGRRMEAPAANACCLYTASSGEPDAAHATLPGGSPHSHLCPATVQGCPQLNLPTAWQQATSLLA